ncbi:ABC transporter substrate-binding protein [Paenibacillus oceani]|uniref:ABC transporter substrate-binding protein n=1 Tax=Paenibacillus oceani TaxID=2772510 RepID=A0A927CEM6_9BACL|nr:ABC transporter substrate-binding protein [Paenibacillus oceani]MBD2866669.1 ABC transporter substrate-binding protein [Paenibacillus oceani]
MNIRNFISSYGFAASFLLFVILLASCSNEATTGGAATSAGGTQAAAGTGGETVPDRSGTADSAKAEATKPAVRTITDYTKRKLDIPAEPKKIVYVGSSPGDFFVLGVKPVGATLGVISSQIVYPELLGGIEDIGSSEPNLEKMTMLEPDLILFDGVVYDGKAEALGKIAPAVAYDSAAPMYERLRFMAEVTGKQMEAENWITGYEAKVKTVLDRLQTSPDDTASVLLQLGKQLYVMGNRGLAVTVFDVLGFTPSPKVKEIIDDSKRFITVSSEVLPEYTGDWLFLLSNNSEETVAAKKALTDSAIWNSLPAVKNGQVYAFESKWNFDDPITRERLLDELTRIMGK